MWYIGSEENTDYIAHYGILGQKWGIRRYQNPDGSLTPEGRARYGSQENYERALRKHDRNVKIAQGVAVGALAGLAIYGGAKYLKNKKAIMRQLQGGLNSSEFNALKNMYSGQAMSYSYDDLVSRQKEVLNMARNNKFGNPNYKAFYDALGAEIKRRDAISKTFTGEGEKAIAGLAKTFTDRSTSELTKGMGTAVGAAAVGALVATAKQLMEQRDRSEADKANEYANYMWQNPNKK